MDKPRKERQGLEKEGTENREEKGRDKLVRREEGGQEERKRVQFDRARVLVSKKSLIRCSRQRNPSFSEDRRKKDGW